MGAQVCDLAEKVYRLAEILVTPAVQLELCTKFDEPFITPKIFMDYFNQVRMFSFNFPPLLVGGVLGLNPALSSCFISRDVSAHPLILQRDHETLL